MKVGQQVMTADNKKVTIEQISTNHCYFAIRDEEGNLSECSSQFIFTIPQCNNCIHHDYTKSWCRYNNTHRAQVMATKRCAMED